MPIVYEQAQPNPAAIASAYGAAQTRLQAAPQTAQLLQQGRFEANRTATDAARLQGQLASQDADRLQSGLLAQQRQDLDERQFAAAGTPNDRDSFLTQAAQAQENQRFQNQAALIGVELTTQERMRLSRMKSAIGDVQNDPTLTDQEKADLVVRLRTGIDPLEQRLARQKFEMDKMVKEEMISAKRAETALQSERLKFISGDFDKHIKIDADPRVKRAAAETVRILHPTLDPNSDEFKAAVEEQIIETGEYTRYKPNAKGEMEPMDESKFGDVGKGARAGKGRGQGQMTQQDYVRAYADVLATVAKDENVPAGDKQKVAAERMKAIMDGYAQHQAATTPAKPAPFNPNVEGSGTEAQRVQVFKTRQAVSAVNARPDLDGPTKDRVRYAAAQAQRILARYTGPDGRFVGPPAVRERLAEYQAVLNQYSAPPETAPPAPVPAAVAPSLKSRLRSGGRELLGSLHPGLPGAVGLE